MPQNFLISHQNSILLSPIPRCHQCPVIMWSGQWSVQPGESSWPCQPMTVVMGETCWCGAVQATILSDDMQSRYDLNPHTSVWYYWGKCSLHHMLRLCAVYSALVGAGPSALTSAWEPEPQAGAGQSPISDWSTLGILACDWSIQSTGCCHRHSPGCGTNIRFFTGSWAPSVARSSPHSHNPDPGVSRHLTTHWH